MVWQCNKAYYKCLPSKGGKCIHFPLLPTVKVLALSPKQPHACGNNQALSFFCTNMKVQFNHFGKYCITSGWENFCHSNPVDV